MALTASGSPLPAPAPGNHFDETHLPKGQCRYILMTPGLKGNRCACVSFHHNSEVPGASCDCGHLSCFHLSSSDAPSPARNRPELETLQHRLQLLEEHTGLGDHHGGLTSIVTRVNQLEEIVDRSREEMQTEIKGSYRNISGAWQLVEQMQKRTASLEELYRVHSDQLERAEKELRDLQNRQLELVDSDESLEERIEKLEGVDEFATAAQPPTPRASIVDSSTSAPAAIASRLPRESERFVTRTDQRESVVRVGDEQPKHFDVHLEKLPGAQPSFSPQSPPASSPSTATSWTVHVSLLPSRSYLFPFEKDSTAYKRCLSRGLHRMVAVGGLDAQSFVSAVSTTFADVLRGRPWDPLKATVSEEESPQGSPSFRPLDTGQDQANYDAAFLREHCALCDKRGRIESLYVALRNDALTWEYVRALPIYVGGLEQSWELDERLDTTETCKASNPTPVVLPPTPGLAPEPRNLLKRTASEFALATGFDLPSMNCDGDGSRSKIARLCQNEMHEMRRGVGTAQ